MPKFLPVLGILAMLALAACGGSATVTVTQSHTSQSTVAPVTVTTSTPAQPGKTYAETADRHGGVQLYNNNQGSEASGSLPFGTVVQVMCLAPNESGMSSIDPGFYQFSYDGRMTFAISNEFANGDPLGDPSGSTTVDPNVPRC